MALNDKVIAPSKPDAVKFAQLAITPPTAVTVNAPVPTLELASKITSSADVGALAPLAPPEDADQFAVEVESQLPEPPTQYLVAIYKVLYKNFIFFYRCSHNCVPSIKALLLHV